jgi:hypothetical protein
MSLLHALEGLFLRLSIIPGFGFLYEYVHELETQHGRRRAIVANYRGYVSTLKDAGKDVKNLGHHGHEGHGHEGHSGHDEAESGLGHGADSSRHGGESSRRGHASADAHDYDEDDFEDDFESYLQY